MNTSFPIRLLLAVLVVAVLVPAARASSGPGRARQAGHRAERLGVNAQPSRPGDGPQRPSRPGKRAVVSQEENEDDSHQNRQRPRQPAALPFQPAGRAAGLLKHGCDVPLPWHGLSGAPLYLRLHFLLL